MLEYIQRTAINLVKGMEGMSSKRRLRTLMGERSVKGDLTALYNFLRRVKGSVHFFYLLSSDGMVAVAPSYIRRGSH